MTRTKCWSKDRVFPETRRPQEALGRAFPRGVVTRQHGGQRAVVLLTMPLSRGRHLIQEALLHFLRPQTQKADSMCKCQTRHDLTSKRHPLPPLHPGLSPDGPSAEQRVTLGPGGVHTVLGALGGASLAAPSPSFPAGDCQPRANPVTIPPCPVTTVTAQRGTPGHLPSRVARQPLTHAAPQPSLRTSENSVHLGQKPPMTAPRAWCHWPQDSGHRGQWP